MVVGCSHNILVTALNGSTGDPISNSAGENLDPISEAVAKASAAANLTQTASTWEEWQTVAQNWQEAVAQLETVPREHDPGNLASQKIQEYQKNLTYARQQFARLDPLKPAFNKGSRASQLTRVAATKREWEEGVQGWQEAIAHLKAIPTTYPKYPLVQQKLTEYERNLTFSEQQLSQFHPFYDGIAKAEEAAQLAQTASTMEDWEGIALLWKQAIAILESISPEDEKATLAASQINRYENYLTSTHQQIARIDPYNRAFAKAEQARKLEKTASSMVEWEEVTREWQEAVAHLESMPPSHPKSAVAQQMLTESKLNLAYAQQQVQETDPFDRAIATAESATQLTASAFSLYDWNAIASQWQEAIALLQTVPKTHSKHPLVAQKMTIYQTALEYAIQQSQQRLEPFSASPAPPPSLAKTAL